MSLRSHLKLTLIVMALISCSGVAFAPAIDTDAASSPSASEVIAQINQYRTQNGLPAYRVNSSLMSSAQAQSDHQAAINSVTHTGPGGSRPRDRAYAAGYGGDSTIWISEIIYCGNQATVATAMSWWKGSQVHNDSMLSTRYEDIGAGVATSGGKTYFTAVMAVVAGGSASDSGGDSEGGAESGVPVVPVVKATARADGSIVHEVQTGQTLWTIAAVYEVPLDTLLSLNDLPNSTIVYPGQEILVRPAQTPEPISTPTREMGEKVGESRLEPTSTRVSTSDLSTARPSTTPRAALAQAGEGETTSGELSRPNLGDAEGQSSSVGSIALGMVVLYTLIAVLTFALRVVEEPDQGA